VVEDRHPIIVVTGGVPGEAKEAWIEEFASDRVRFLFADHPLNPAEARNIALREAETNLVAVIDNDVRPRTGWLDALVSCQHDTGAAFVVPIILERPTVIHCAGTDFYIDVVGGARMGHKSLRHFGKPYHDGCNLRRCEIDYGELHCHLSLRQDSIDNLVFDELITEVGEVDVALELRKVGHTIWFEPSAVVLFDRFLGIDEMDIAQYEMKWDPHTMLEGLRHFYEKWGVDATEDGAFSGFLCETNALLGRLPRRFRSNWAIMTSTFVRKGLTATFRAPQSLRFALHKRQYGGAEWDAWISEARRRGRQPVSPALPMLHTDADFADVKVSADG
jgi:glycosyltransferase involved in cell wall biosynthesis